MLSRWFVPAKPVGQCLLRTKSSVCSALPAPFRQCQSSTVPSYGTNQLYCNVQNASRASLLGNRGKSVNLVSVRSYMRVYYKPSAWKRYNKHNIEKRLTTNGGLDILWRRVLKGRHNLAVYERILPNTHDSKILHKHQLRFRKHPLTKHKLPKPGLF